MRAIMVLALCCVSVRAQSTSVVAARFDDADFNKDGVIELDEYSFVFKLFDVNADGSVAREEFVSVWSLATGSSYSDAAYFFNLLDYNGDGRIDQAEKLRSFNVFDADGNGSVSKAEFLKRWSEVKP